MFKEIFKEEYLNAFQSWPFTLQFIAFIIVLLIWWLYKRSNDKKHQASENSRLDTLKEMTSLIRLVLELKETSGSKDKKGTAISNEEIILNKLEDIRGILSSHLEELNKQDQTTKIIIPSIIGILIYANIRGIQGNNKYVQKLNELDVELRKSNGFSSKPIQSGYGINFHGRAVFPLKEIKYQDTKWDYIFLTKSEVLILGSYVKTPSMNVVLTTDYVIEFHDNDSGDIRELLKIPVNWIEKSPIFLFFHPEIGKVLLIVASFIDKSKIPKYFLFPQKSTKDGVTKFKPELSDRSWPYDLIVDACSKPTFTDDIGFRYSLDFSFIEDEIFLEMDFLRIETKKAIDYLDELRILNRTDRSSS